MSYYINRVELSRHNRVINETIVRQGLTLRQALQDIISLAESLPSNPTIYHNPGYSQGIYKMGTVRVVQYVRQYTQGATL